MSFHQIAGSVLNNSVMKNSVLSTADLSMQRVLNTVKSNTILNFTVPKLIRYNQLSSFYGTNHNM